MRHFSILSENMFHFISHWLNQRIIRRSTITSTQWEQAFSCLPLLDRLNSDEKHALRELTTLFLHNKVFEGAQGVTVTTPMMLIISLQACLPILKLGLDCYSGWYSIIVYASGFAHNRQSIDEIGVVHDEQSNLAGESWQRGPVVLAWDESERAGRIDGHNLVIHEFAHKLDMQNGVANGYPPLHKDMDHRAWVEVFTSGYADFQQQCERGKTMGIDCYAASSPAEFFAVLSEVFFERPYVLKQHYPAIYNELRQYYRQDPVSCYNNSAL